MLTNLLGVIVACCGSLEVHTSNFSFWETPEAEPLLGISSIEETPFDETIGIGETRYHFARPYFGSTIGGSYVSDADIGYYEAFLTLAYLDYVKNDNVLTGSQEWSITMPSFLSIYQESPVYFSADITSFWQWIKTQSINSNMAYVAPVGFPTQTYEYFQFFLSSYLSSKSFLEATEYSDNDFCLATIRGLVWFYYSGSDIEFLFGDSASGAAMISVQQGNIAFFNLMYPISYGGVLYYGPFIATGYTRIGYDSYQVIGFHPKIGELIFNPEQIFETTVLGFTASHIHSHNLHVTTEGVSYCGCGHRECLGAHSLSVTYNVNPSAHSQSCSNCDYVFEQGHEWHYQRINALKHRKYCSICGHSVLENHLGNYCICQLQD